MLWSRQAFPYNVYNQTYYSKGRNVLCQVPKMSWLAIPDNVHGHARCRKEKYVIALQLRHAIVKASMSVYCIQICLVYCRKDFGMTGTRNVKANIV